MGIYDIVGIEENIQIKCTKDPCMGCYNLHDYIDLADALYVGYEGWFVVKDKRVSHIGVNMFDKWGNKLSKKDILNPKNPIAQGYQGS